MIRYKKLIVYYFSGTGNAKKAAEWIIETAKGHHIETELINIVNYRFSTQTRFGSKTLIGFCSPTHGFNLPPIMLKFIRHFPKSDNTDFFILNTRAGMKLHKLFLPGLSGLAQILPVLILSFKGYRVVGMQPLDLPSNWISLHPGLRDKVVRSIFERCGKISKKFANKIIAGKKVYKALLSLPIDIAIIPFSFAYYFYGRFVIAKTFIATNACIDCGLCQKECPVNAIEKINGRLYWKFTCESCMHCINYCPQKAIQTPHTYTAAVWWLAFSALPLLFAYYMAPAAFKELPAVKILYNVFEAVTGLIIIYFAYKTLHFFMRFSFFNKIISYTSLTKYKFWRRYKSI
jgi:Pyruvate/2-oxoacid:ferredoxin oxidoreductase delta subunit